MHLHYIVICLQSIQILRIFKIFQYASLIDGLMVMMLTLKACLKELFLLVMYLLIAMFIFATSVSFLELQSEMGVGVPDCVYGYWWAIITMTTVGYGDFYPSTVGGYFVGVLCAISGIILTALPVAIIGSHFNVYWEHNRKRRRLLFAALKKKHKQKNISAGTTTSDISKLNSQE
ncbi:shk-1 [Bugula neritina]|uniref:Shk-1 n=1 Tax=Bugula neritina TaxID=10212 RepID=A0A7J7JM43_BUGNE|nr:shk-1 [Bugula neritina]